MDLLILTSHLLDIKRPNLEPSREPEHSENLTKFPYLSLITCKIEIIVVLNLKVIFNTRWDYSNRICKISCDTYQANKWQLIITKISCYKNIFYNPKTLKFQKENTLESIPTLYPDFFELVNFLTAFGHRGFPGSSVVKNLFAVQETQVWSLGWEDPLEKVMLTHSSILAWRIP